MFRINLFTVVTLGKVIHLEEKHDELTQIRPLD